jgi:hypothetical protein
MKRIFERNVSLVILTIIVLTDMILIVRVRSFLTCEILLNLFYEIELNRMRINTKAGAHQSYETFGDRSIGMNILPNRIDTNREHCSALFFMSW